MNDKDNILSEYEYNNKYGKWFCPTSGFYANQWKYFLLINILIVAIFIPTRVAFETKPKFYSVYFELYMSVVFLFDMIITFNTPVKETQKQIKSNFNRIDIAKHYLRTWFFIDLYGFFPLAYLRHISDYEKGSHDDFENL